MNLRRSITLLATFLSLTAFSNVSHADSVANFYKDKQVSIVVAARAGGGHHKYSLFISPFMKKHMPGNPTFITQNMGGAGGTKAANYLYNRAAKNGTAIGILLSDTDRPHLKPSFPWRKRERCTHILIGPVDEARSSSINDLILAFTRNNRFFEVGLIGTA